MTEQRGTDLAKGFLRNLLFHEPYPYSQDAAADADALRLKFTRDQAEWITHHIRNALCGMNRDDLRAECIQRCIRFCDAVAAIARGECRDSGNPAS